MKGIYTLNLCVKLKLNNYYNIYEKLLHICIYIYVLLVA